VGESGVSDACERVKQGYGEMVWLDGRRYLGHWRGNEMDGFGYLKNTDDSFY